MSTPIPVPGSPREVALRMAGQGQLAEAVEWLEGALAVASGHDEQQALASALGEVARTAEAASDFDAAERALEAATRTVEWADLFCQLGCLLANRGRRAEARIALDRALSINPRYRTAAVERALLDAREGRIAEAMQTMRALAADGELAEPGAFHLGLERLGDADFEDAAPLLRRALQGGDAWLEVQLHEYQERLFVGDMSGGLALLRAAAGERPGYPDLYLLLGRHERHMGAFDDAVGSLAHALELNPEYHAARVELARTLELIGDTPQSLSQLALVIAHDPGHEEARTLHERLASRRLGGRAPQSTRVL